MTANAMRQRVSATVTGTGSRMVVMANGLGTAQQTWRHVVAGLQGRATCLRFDNVCSPAAPPGGYRVEAYSSLHGYVDDILGVLDELDARDVIFVGASVSGIIGLLAAAAAPERIAHVVTICSTPRFIVDVDYPIGMPRDTVEALLAEARDDYVGWATRFAVQAIGSDATAADLAEFTALLTAMRPDIAIRALQTIFLSDHRDVLPRVSQPVSVLHARGDRTVPLAAGEYLVRHLPDATLYPLMTNGHLPQLTAPREVVSTLHRILDAAP